MTDPGSTEQFAASLSELELRVAAADAGGEPVPPEAREMLARLREITDALHALTQSIEQRAAHPDEDTGSSASPETSADDTPGA